MNISGARTSQVELLDSRSAFERLDPSALRHRLKALPNQCEEAWAQAGSAELLEGNQPITNVVIGGMGGSAMAGDLVADLAAEHPSVPVTVVRDFFLPMTLSPGSLFIACSYSGATDETLALYRQAMQQKSRVLVIAGGGPLAEQAQASQIPLLTINAAGEPRSAVGYNLMLLLGALNRLGVLSVNDDEVYTAIAKLRQQIASLDEETPTQENLAKQLALEADDRLLLVYGGGIFTGMARRWKSQLNENSKAWAFFENLPELLHNAVESYSTAPGQSEQEIVLVLRPNGGAQELQSRYSVLSRLLEQKNIHHVMLPGIAGTPLAQLLSMLTLGDYFSYYLALLRGIDPSPTPAINLGKELLNDEPPSI